MPNDRTYIVTEVCPNCGVENEIHGWDTDRDGFTAYCPHCGCTMMLCDECMHAEDNPGKICDWHNDHCFRMED